MFCKYLEQRFESKAVRAFGAVMGILTGVSIYGSPFYNGHICVKESYILPDVGDRSIDLL